METSIFRDTYPVNIVVDVSACSPRPCPIAAKIDYHQQKFAYKEEK